MNELTAFAEAASMWVGKYLLAFASIGALTMAIIQSIKELTPLKSWFHERALKQWLARCSDGATNKEDTTTCLLTELIGLSTAGDAPALFTLDVEKLAGLIAAAAAVVVDFPSRHVALLRCLAAQADPRDLHTLVTAADAGRAHLDQMRDHDRPQFDAFMDGRARVTHQIQRNIDGFQISTGFRWKWALQVASLVVSFVLATVALAFSNSTGMEWATLLRSLPLALAAGFLAPIARDLLAIVNKARS